MFANPRLSSHPLVELDRGSICRHPKPKKWNPNEPKWSCVAIWKYRDPFASKTDLKSLSMSPGVLSGIEYQEARHPSLIG